MLVDQCIYVFKSRALLSMLTCDIWLSRYAEMVDLLQHHIWCIMLCRGVHSFLHGWSTQLVARWVLLLVPPCGVAFAASAYNILQNLPCSTLSYAALLKEAHLSGPCLHNPYLSILRAPKAHFIYTSLITDCVAATSRNYVLRHLYACLLPDI